MERSQQIRYFLFSQYLSDGIRITLEIIIPAVVFSYLGQLETGLTLSLGALCVSISDGPGPVQHKRNGMLFCNIFVFISAMLTGFLNHNPISLGILILLSAFLFTMLSVFGNRASSIGFAALLIMILQMTRVIPFAQVLTDSLLILAGGIWYMLLALIFYKLTPYRPAQRAIGDCFREMASYVKVKAEMYNPTSDLQTQYHKLLEQQVVVNERQDAARELLFKNRALLKESTRTGRMLLLTFIDSVDLFEHITATGYDYATLRNNFTDTGILPHVSSIITNLANKLNDIGEAIQSNSSYKKEYNIQTELAVLKKEIDLVSTGRDSLMLKKVFANIQNLDEKIEEILQYFNEDISVNRKLRSGKEYSRFVTQQDISWKVFKNNLTFQSTAFRHSLRMAITCAAGYLLATLLLHGHHSYWIIMTIIIILKPAYSLTKQKNKDRLLGTIGGGIIGLLLLYFVHNKVVLFSFLVFFMLGTYTFNTLNYIVMVIFLTPYILILFHFLGIGALNLAGERLLDTAAGSVLAALASYILFPQWESSQLRTYMISVLKANIHYLEKLKELFAGKPISSLDYKLVRKELFVSTANLAAALHRMLSEPKNKQRHSNEIYEFVVLNNLLSSNIASLTSEMMQKPAVALHEDVKKVEFCISDLKQSLGQLEKSNSDKKLSDETATPAPFSNSSQMQWPVQLEFIRKLIYDIHKISGRIVS